jgi:hypothetical protein
LGGWEEGVVVKSNSKTLPSGVSGWTKKSGDSKCPA